MTQKRMAVTYVPTWCRPAGRKRRPPACRQLLRRWLRPWRRRLPADLDSSHQPPQPLRTAWQQHGPLPPRIL